MTGTTEVPSRVAEEPPPPESAGRPWWLSVLAGGLAALVAFHLVLTTLFVAPDNPLSRAVSAPVAAYMNPLFQQDWSLFAPMPISTGYSLWVRGWYEDGRSTEWVDATAVEIEASITHELAPSRAGIVTRRTAGLMRSQYRDLTEDERTVLGADHLSGAWEEMATQMAAVPEPSSSARRSYVLRLDRALTAYATQFAWAWWGRDSDLTHVQVSIEDTRAPRFAERENGPSHVVRELGRRPLYVYDDQDHEAFAATIERFRS